MLHYYFLQILFTLLLIFSLTSGRQIYYDPYKEQQKSQLDSYPDNEDQSPEEREFHQRSIFPTSSASQSRKELIDLLRKAYNQGWKPNLKHYIPATRFGRHRR